MGGPDPFLGRLPARQLQDLSGFIGIPSPHEHTTGHGRKVGGVAFEPVRCFHITGDGKRRAQGRFPLADAAKAIDQLDTGRSSGKTVIIVRDTESDLDR